MKTQSLIFLGFAFAAAFFAGCAQLPLQTLHEAEKSLEEAKKAGAELYAFPQFKAAQVSLGLAKKEIFDENRKLPFMRKYRRIVETLNSAATAARSACAAVNAAKAQVRSETESVIHRVRSSSDSAAALLKKVPEKNRGTLAAGLDSVTAAVADAERSLGADNLLAAKEKATAAQATAMALVDSIEKVMPLKRMKKRPRQR